MAALAAGTAFSALFVVAGATVPAAAAPGSGCPANKLGSIPTATNVAADFSNSGNTSTYYFYSLQNQTPSGGVPGLVKYCVYPTPTSQPTTITPMATGANGAAWLSAKGSNNFAFVRPGGDKTNIPLDGNTTKMGTATWSTAPTNTQDIVLHINDRDTCQGLYGIGTPLTCFVKPSAPVKGPICDKGDKAVAYNAMPTDVVNCLNPGVAFEANQWNEFGDSVTLSGTGTLDSLVVDFQSFACVTGTWDNQGGNNFCGGGTTAGVSPGTFTWPITANVYAAGSNGLPQSLIASTSVNAEIPFRPNADATSCPATPTKWFNPLAPGGGACQNSIATKLTFDFLGQSLPADGKVVWTVAFNTSTSGYDPVGPSTPDCTLLVCPLNPADSLNVGDKTYPTPAPYAGTSLFDTNGGLAVGSKGQDPLLQGLGFYTPDDGGRPLGEIITTP